MNNIDELRQWASQIDADILRNPVDPCDVARMVRRLFEEWDAACKEARS